MNELLFQLRFYLNAFWIRRWLVAGAAWLFCILGWSVVAIVPDVYSSTGRLYVDTASVLQPLLQGLAIDLDGDVRAKVRTIEKTLLSRPNLVKVARITNKDVEPPSESDLARVADRIAGGVTIAGGRDNLFTIEYNGSDPTEARDVVDALIAIFVETNVGTSRAELDKARQFIDGQIKSYETQLELAEQRAAKFKQENIDLLPGAAGYHGRLDRARTELIQAESALREAMARRDVLARELEVVPEFLEFESGEEFAGVGPPTGEEGQIMEMEFQLQELLSSYTESHPDVIVLKRRLEAVYEKREQSLQAELASIADSELEDQEEGFTAQFRTYNPAHPQLRIRLLEEEARIQNLQTGVEQKLEEVESLELLAAQVPLVEAEHAKLNRDYLVLSNKYQELITRRESARISHEREVLRAEKTQFRVVDPPRVPNLPSGPNRALFLIAVTVVGLGAAIALVGGLIIFDQTFRDGNALNKAFGRRIIGTIMIVPSRRERFLQPASLYLFLIVTLSLPGSLGTLLYVERQYGLGSLKETELVGNLTRHLPPLSDVGL